jgi:ribosome biogenesis GTPase
MRLAVEDQTEKVHRCVARRSAGRVVCGDRVRWLASNQGDGVVLDIEPRTTVLHRRDLRGRPTPLAANFDRLIIVAAPRPAIDPFLIDRYLVEAETLDVTPILAFNKSDLFGVDGLEGTATLAATYGRLGYQCVATTTRTATGVDALAEALCRHTGVLVGQSGVGKSSLVQKLLPDRNIRIGALSQATGLGSHTTSTTFLYPLPSGGELIDSPGVRDFALSHLSFAQVAAGFREIREFAQRCRFKNCSHRIEPGCAVRHALGKGLIDARRYASYSKIYQMVAGG